MGGTDPLKTEDIYNLIAQVEKDNCWHFDHFFGETTMFKNILNGLLAKVVEAGLGAIGKDNPTLKPFLDMLTKLVLDTFLKNLSNGTSTGVMAMTAGVTQEQMQAAYDKTVTDMTAN